MSSAVRTRGGEAKPPGAIQQRTAGIRRLYGDTRAELRKIAWPDADTTRNLTLVVIGVSVALGLLLGGIDWVLFQVFEALS